MRIFTLILSIISIVGTALPIFRASFWWIRIFDYPRVQIAVLCLVSLLLIIKYFPKGLPKKLLFILVFLSLGYQLVYIIPYTPLMPVQAESFTGKASESSFSILEANIKMDNREIDKFLTLVNDHKPDILVITEPDKWWQNKLQQLDGQYPYSVEKPMENTYGIIVYSKLPLKDTRIDFLVKDNIPSIYSKVVLPDDQVFDLYALHPEPPKPGNSTYERDTEILIVGRQIRLSKRPTVVVGDLNDVSWSYTSQLFQRYSRMLDPRRGRSLFNTYNVFIPLFRYPLDHFFYSKHFGLIRMKKLTTIGSDHFPMLIEINLTRNREFENGLPQADAEDKEEVKETIEEN